MLVGIISDSHDRIPALRQGIEVLLKRKVQAIIHAGDFVAPFAAKLLHASMLPVPLYCVYGNNDGERAGLKSVLPGLVDGPLKIELAGRRIVVHHFIDWLSPQDLAAADVIITGHTHCVVNESRNGVLYLNPGECCGWLTGRCTVAVLDLSTLIAEIIELPGS